MQTSIHAQSGGARVGPTRQRFKRPCLSVTTPFPNLLEGGRIAGRPNGMGATQTTLVTL
ncbi:MAG TPA: hypothetical protein VED37_17860 [Ktedonobacteraceae bacterium]|nr:hypothetical protein [Ktedonobacteraceae bacterium]